jgi:hypothetical protein
LINDVEHTAAPTEIADIKKTLANVEPSTQAQSGGRPHPIIEGIVEV